MACCTVSTAEAHFGKARVRKELEAYRQEGPGQTARRLLDALMPYDLQGATLLDVGAGIGGLAHALWERGLRQATLVDMSSAYLAAAEEEARQRERHAQMHFIYGDFVDVEQQVHEHDVVLLDRVVCCYPEAEPLLRLSARKSRRWYGLSYPRHRWYVRFNERVDNWRRARSGDPFQSYVHPERLIHRTLDEAGLRPVYEGGTLFWKVALYQREGRG